MFFPKFMQFSTKLNATEQIWTECGGSIGDVLPRAGSISRCGYCIFPADRWTTAVVVVNSSNPEHNCRISEHADGIQGRGQGIAWA
jgi:hypothetical protein